MMKHCVMQASMLEVYNEDIRDLLGKGPPAGDIHPSAWLTTSLQTQNHTFDALAHLPAFPGMPLKYYTATVQRTKSKATCLGGRGKQAWHSRVNA